MLRDSNKYNQALLLRQSGNSIKAISRKLQISTSTASVWCKNVRLTPQQLLKLQERGQSKEVLRLFAQKRHEDKVERHDTLFNTSRGDIRKLSQVQFFLTGIALYWAEGFKSLDEQRVGFCNSDPRMVKFIMRWFRNSLKIPEEDFILRAEFNISHIDRVEEIESYWSTLTDIPRVQFNKPYLQKVKLLRDYSNRKKYYGVLRIRIRRSSQLLVKLLGWIEGLSVAA